MSTRPLSSSKVIFALFIVALLSFILGRDGSFKAQLLSTPETIQNVKLVRHNGAKVRYDIYYEGLNSETPESTITIIIANVLLHQGGRFNSMSRIVDSAILTIGTSDIASSGTSQIIKISGITRQGTTKLGTLFTPFSPLDLVSIEYDVLLGSDRYTIIDPPLPQDFPADYQGFINPVSETLFIETPDTAHILSPDEKIFTKAAKIPFAAMMLSNTLTSLQPLESLNKANLIARPASLTVPKLIIEQHFFQIPLIQRDNVNTLMIRYRSGKNQWIMKSFFLPAMSNVTLPVPVTRLLDFYTEVDYAFAHIGSGFNTLQLDFPAHSLITNESPAFYRTDFVSLIPELQKDRQALELNVTVYRPETPNTLAIGLLTREPLRDLDAAVNLLSQFQPLALLDGSSTVLKTAVNKSTEVPFLNLIGKQNQLWIQKIQGSILEFLSASFKTIPLPEASEAVPDLDLITTLSGDRLLCLIQSQKGSFSLPLIEEDVMLSSTCLETARRLGFREGKIFPLVYRIKSNTLEALRPFPLDAQISLLRPEVKVVDQKKKMIGLVSSFQSKKAKIMVSATPTFDAIALQSTEIVDKNTLKLPTLPSCEVGCYVKVLSVLREDKDAFLVLPSDTVRVTGESEASIQLCFFNQSLIDPLYTATELKFQVLRPKGEPIEMNYSDDRKCYELNRLMPGVVSVADASSVDEKTDEKKEELKAPEPEILFNNFSDLVTTGFEFPPDTIIFHSNGLATSHITIPPQRHYLELKPNTQAQLLLTNLVFEHGHFETRNTEEKSNVLKKSYQISLLGNMDEISYKSRGNVLLFTKDEKPYFLERLPVAPPINETLLFPGGKRILQIPNVIRMLAPDDVLISGFDKSSRRILLPLLVPERSDVKIFLDNIFRPGIESQQLLTDGMTFDVKTRLLSLQQPKGLITLPLIVRKNVPTTATLFSKTFPPTPVPSDLTILSLDLPLTLEVMDPPDISSTSILSPALMTKAFAGKTYQEKIPFGGIEMAKTFEITGAIRFMSENCKKLFSFDKDTRELTAKIPLDTKLEGCLFELPVRYLATTTIGDQEVKTTRVYGIPILSSFSAKDKPVIALELTIDRAKEEVSGSLTLPFPLDEIYETSPEYALKGTEQGLISKIGDISISVDRTKGQLNFSGKSKDFSGPVTRYLMAIRRDTAAVERLTLTLISARKGSSEVKVIKGFSEKIALSDLLKAKGYSSDEIATVRRLGPFDSTLIQDQGNGQFLLNGDSGLETQSLSFLLLKTPPAKTGFESFDERLSEKQVEKFEREETVVITFKLIEPAKVKTKSITLRGGKFFTVDLGTLLPTGHEFSLLPTPDFIKTSGMSLSGTAPKTAQNLELVLKDLTNRQMVTIPIQILAEEKIVAAPPPVIPQTPPPPSPPLPYQEPTPPSPPPSTPPAQVELPLKQAAEEKRCFPDIADLSASYQDAICKAKELSIISGSGGLFNPHDPINRAEVAKILITGPLVLMKAITPEEISSLEEQFPEQQFSDVPLTAWFFGFVQAAYESGIVKGNPDGTYRPAALLNVAEAAKLIIETIRSFRPEAFSGEESLEAVIFPDEPWFFPYIRLVALSGGDYPEPEEISNAALPIERAEFIFNLMAVLKTRVPALGSSPVAE